MATITIPKETKKSEKLVAIPKADYEKLKRMFWEVVDTDDAVAVFKKEKRSGKLKSAASFGAILKSAERHA
mgnify:CR=1 FL=1